MKKLAIAGSAVALAAMPVVGVFATQSTVRTITDTVELELPLSCTMSVAAGTTEGITNTISYASGQEQTEANITGVKYSGTLTAGHNKEVTGTAMTIACNDTDGWAINATGAGTSTVNTSMAASTTASDDIATGVTALDGTVSEWGFKIALSGTNAGSYATIQSNGVSGKTYADYSVIPASDTEIVGFSGPISSEAVVTVTPTYKVSFAPTQAGATYTGKVQYTLLHPEN